MENLDNLKIPELMEVIIRVKAETEVIKKETEAIRKETEAIRKETEAMCKKNQKEINQIKKETQAIRKEAEIIRKETDEIKKAAELSSQKNMEKIERQIQENNALDKKYKEEQKIMNQHLYSMGIGMGMGLEDGMFNLLESNLTLEGIKYDSIQKNCQYHDPITKQTLGEADLILINGQHVAIIEIKHRLTIKILSEFYLKKIPIITKNDPHFKSKKIHYYIATSSYEDAVIPKAKKLGIGIVEPSFYDIITILKAA